MAFIWEELTSNASSTLSEKYSFREPKTNKLVKPKSRVVDNERNAFMVCLQSEPPVQTDHNPDIYFTRYTYELIWKEQRTQILYVEHVNRRHLTFNPAISEMAAPKILEPDADELLQIIKDAFAALVHTYEGKPLEPKRFYMASERPYFDTGHIIDANIETSFAFIEIPIEKAKALDTQHAISSTAAASLGVKPETIISRLTHALADEKNNAYLYCLGVTGIWNGVDIAEHFLLLWNDEPIYLRRKYYIFMTDQLQMVGNIVKIVAHKRLGPPNKERFIHATKIIGDAIAAYGLGETTYTRGPLANHNYAKWQFIDDGDDVISIGFHDDIDDVKPEAKTSVSTVAQRAQARFTAELHTRRWRRSAIFSLVIIVTLLIMKLSRLV